jgi:hypothetical protein
MEQDFSSQDVLLNLAQLESQEFDSEDIEDEIEYLLPERNLKRKLEHFYIPLTLNQDSKTPVASFISVKNKKTVTTRPYPRMVYVKCNRSDCNNTGIMLHPHFREVHYHTAICIKHDCSHDNEKDCVVVQCIEASCNST